MKAHDSFHSKSSTISCLSEQRDGRQGIVCSSCSVPIQYIKSIFMIQHKEPSKMRVRQIRLSPHVATLRTLSLQMSERNCIRFRISHNILPNPLARLRADCPSKNTTRLHLSLLRLNIPVFTVQMPIRSLYRLIQGV